MAEQSNKGPQSPSPASGANAPTAVNDPARNPARNLTNEDRVRGGLRSSAAQSRDQGGRFAGRQGGQDTTSRNGGASSASGRRGGANGTQIQSEDDAEVANPIDAQEEDQLAKGKTQDRE
jgi:hypothetical protein